MNQRFLRCQLLSLLAIGCGCSPGEPSPRLPTTVTIFDETATDEAATVDNGDDADDRAPVVDPAVDAGMMADELERRERVKSESTTSPDAPAEKDAPPKD